MGTELPITRRRFVLLAAGSTAVGALPAKTTASGSENEEFEELGYGEYPYGICPYGY